MKKKTKRFWELDFLRGIALILMIALHFIFDLNDILGIESVDYRTKFWYYEGRISAFLFIALAGITSVLIYKKYPLEEAIQKNFKRCIKIAVFALLVTIATWIFDAPRTIWFGILHFLSVCILITIPILRFKWISIGIGLVAALIGGYLFTLKSTSWAWLPLGIRPIGFSTFDYYPIFPWITFFLIGIFLGHILYKTPEPISRRYPGKTERGLAVIGKYSLWIYMIHQPVIIGILLLIRTF
jgi:uncharacterized membrane protein